jgi:integrase
MASFEKVDGGWRAHIARAGVRKSKTFSSKTAATLWAAQQESEIASGGHSKWPNMTFADAMRKYELEVSPKKRGKDFEAKRFAALARDFPGLIHKVISEITAADLASWRDTRLAQVSNSTVLRETALYRNVFSVAAREWSWLPEPTPWAKIKPPQHDPARTRQTQPSELKMILHRTGMRAGEILSLSTETVDLSSRVIKLVEHKTLEREGQRFVPITRQARRLLSLLDESARRVGRKTYFSISSEVLDTLFRKARDQMLINNLRFHDARAAALTRLARKVDVMTLARISGHRDQNQLLKSYYRESPAEIAARL